MTRTSHIELTQQRAIYRLPEIVSPLVALLTHNGVEAYLVGGVVRDILLNRDNSDVDIVVNADAKLVSSLIASRLDGRSFQIDADRSIYRVISNTTTIDVATLAGSIHDDLGNRDFAIDAMAISMSKILLDSEHFEVIDPYGGIQDIHSSEIRMISESVFRNDA